MPGIYIINARESMPFYLSSEVITASDIGNFPVLADLTTPTLAALVPPNWDITICDQRFEDVDFDTTAGVIALTGKVSQRDDMKRLAAEFRQRGKLVLAGGPHVSLWPEDMRSHVDILVIGEAEDIAAEIFTDIVRGEPKAEYRGGKPDLKSTPLPRWDLYPYRPHMAGQVQTSRGCPFECEFCDVIQYLGRKQRWKEPGHVIAELDQLYDLRCRDVLLADDNLTVVRERTRKLLEALRDWNAGRLAGRMRFITQLSIDITRDMDLLRLAADAGLDRCFIGIETPNEDSLREARKRQNTRIDLTRELDKIVSTGIMPLTSLIVGFDSDGPDIFSHQARFIATIPSPIILLGMLVAPHGTPLYDRLKAENRLVEGNHLAEGNLLSTNIIPKNMTQHELVTGFRWLLNQVFDPDNWLSRLEKFAELSPPNRNRRIVSVFGIVEARLARDLAGRSARDQRVIEKVSALVRRRPDLIAQVGYALLVYCQTRWMLDRMGLWDEDRAQHQANHAATAGER